MPTQSEQLTAGPAELPSASGVLSVGNGLSKEFGVRFDERVCDVAESCAGCLGDASG